MLLHAAAYYDLFSQDPSDADSEPEQGPNEVSLADTDPSIASPSSTAGASRPASEPALCALYSCTSLCCMLFDSHYFALSRGDRSTMREGLVDSESEGEDSAVLSRCRHTRGTTTGRGPVTPGPPLRAPPPPGLNGPESASDRHFIAVPTGTLWAPNAAPDRHLLEFPGINGAKANQGPPRQVHIRCHQMPIRCGT